MADERSMCDTPVGVTGLDSASALQRGQTSETNRAPVAMASIAAELRMLLEDLHDAALFRPGQLLVVGASSSEVVGERIGTATSMAVGRTLVDEILAFAKSHQLDVAFQCCEHLNRSLVVEDKVATARHLPVVHAIPVPGAGGAVASSAYFAFQSPVLVSQIQADAGIDIGDTLIGMHLKHVAVPVRGRIRAIGQAHVTMAITRPPLVGGYRAVYNLDDAKARIGESV